MPLSSGPYQRSGLLTLAEPGLPPTCIEEILFLYYHHLQLSISRLLSEEEPDAIIWPNSSCQALAFPVYHHLFHGADPQVLTYLQSHCDDDDLPLTDRRRGPPSEPCDLGSESLPLRP